MDERLVRKRIVVTRPAPGTLAERLEALGADVGHVPLIEIGPPSNGGAALAAALDRLHEFDWLVVTSANGATAVGPVAGDVRVAAIGGATADMLETLGRRVDLVPAVSTTEGLLSEFPRHPARVLLVQGNLAGSRLAGGLRELGHDVTAVEAYTTSLRSPSADERSVLASADAILLASGSAAQALNEAGLDHLRASIVTIGPKTAAAARRLGFSVAAVADSPTDDAVIAALRSVLP